MVAAKPLSFQNWPSRPAGSVRMRPMCFSKKPRVSGSFRSISFWLITHRSLVPSIICSTAFSTVNMVLVLPFLPSGRNAYSSTPGLPRQARGSTSAIKNAGCCALRRPPAFCHSRMIRPSLSRRSTSPREAWPYRLYVP